LYYPRTSEKENVETNKRDEHLVTGLVVGVGGTNRSNDQLRYGHPNRTEKKERPSAPFLDQV